VPVPLEAAVAAVVAEDELPLVDCVFDDCELWCSSFTGVVKGSEGLFRAACDLRVNNMAVLEGISKGLSCILKKIYRAVKVSP